jgi:hypothetical protein
MMPPEIDDFNAAVAASKVDDGALQVPVAEPCKNPKDGNWVPGKKQADSDISPGITCLVPQFCIFLKKAETLKLDIP